MTKNVSVYARQSKDVHGDELAVARQLADCRAYAAERGWTITDTFIDNDTSATNGKRRPDFERLLASKPAAILVWHVDRLQRRVTDLERVIELGVPVYAVKAGYLDLSHPAGRAVARTITAWAQYETEQKSLRQVAANLQRANDGLPYQAGRRPFGYERGGMEIRENEAEAVRDGAKMLLAGGTLADIADEWNRRGLTTAVGSKFTISTVRTIMLRPRTHGIRQYQGEIHGPASWPALLDPDTSAALRALMTDPRRRHRKRTRYLMSGIAVCGVCLDSVTGAYTTTHKASRYQCRHPARHVTRNVEIVDTFIVAKVLDRLRDPTFVASLIEGDEGDGDRVHALRVEGAKLRARRNDLAEAFAAGEIDRAMMVAGGKRLDADLAAIDAQLAKVVAMPGLPALVGADDAAAEFLAADLDIRREIIRRTVKVALVPVGVRGAKAEDGIVWSYL